MRKNVSRSRRPLAFLLCILLLAGAILPTLPAISANEIPDDRYECEDATVLAADGVTVIGMSRQADANASGGAVAGNTGGKYFVFENVNEGNCIHIAYASPNTNSMILSIRYPWETTYHAAGVIPFSTSNSWSMSSSYIAISPLVYIPEGSDIRIRPAVDCNLDCLWITTETDSDMAEVPANTLPVAGLSSNTETDIMATYAKRLTLTAGESVTFRAPDTGHDCNVLNISYSAEDEASVALVRGGASIGQAALPATQYRTYGGAGMRTETFAAGEELTLTCTAGTVSLDYIAVNYAPDPEVVEIKTLPDKGERMTISLDGIWAIGATSLPTGDIPSAVPEEVSFADSIPVPGLWSSAAYDLGDYASSLSWYQKTILLDAAPEGQVLLHIGAAQYGRHIYVNGQYVDSYEYNYSRSYTDITSYLHEGENSLVIMLGSASWQRSDPTCQAHVLYDGESMAEEPGITDSVSLIFNAAPEVAAVQTAPDIDAGTLDVQVTLQNRAEQAVTSDVTISIYELGVYHDGVPDREEIKVAEYVRTGVQVGAQSSQTFTVNDLSLSDWSRDKCWSPESPFLYRVEIRTSGDTYSTRFGMRTFDFDPETKYARLNGEIRYLFGTNVVIERYFDDPLCGTTPWQEDWVRKLYTEFRETNWDCFRTHMGHASELWYDLADEMGLMIFDEYPFWGMDNDGCSAESLLPEIYTWIDTRANHPSVIVFDAQNEVANYSVTTEVVKKGRAYDLQSRPWDNGWSAPVGENDPVECHPYIIGANGISGLNDMEVSKPVITTANIGMTYEDYPDHPYILNEHGEYWINREGVAMSGTAGTWNAALHGATNEERLTYYADLMAAQIEAFRTERAYVGLLFFNGLGSSTSSAQGVTSDILSPDVSTAQSLQIRPYTKARLADAFADLGIVIDEYTEEVKRGKQIDLPIVLINDTGEDICDLPVTIKIMSGDTVLYAERITMSVEAFSADTQGVTRETLSVDVPAYRDYCSNNKVLTVTASYELDGQTVTSQRKWKIRGGSSQTDEDLPVYDWLPNQDETETETTPDTSPVTLPETTPETSSETVPETIPATAPDTAEIAPNTLPETTPTEAATSDSDTPAEEDGCGSVVGGSVLLLALPTAAVLLGTRRRRRKVN